MFAEFIAFQLDQMPIADTPTQSSMLKGFFQTVFKRLGEGLPSAVFEYTSVHFLPKIIGLKLFFVQNAENGSVHQQRLENF
jgi:hypothetical protein